jgi:hypothetical protein
LSQATEAVERWTDPVLEKVRPVFERITGWHRGEDKDKPAYGGGLEDPPAPTPAADSAPASA